MNTKIKNGALTERTAMLALSCTLAACGGGGGGGSPPPPAPTTYTIGGTVAGLTGAGLVLQNNGGSNLVVNSAGAFTFAGSVAAGTSYSVSVSAQPANPGQTCVVANGTGTANANVTSVSVTCTTVAAQDSDGDGLDDNSEVTIYGTSPVLADTDGDGYSDRREIIELGFDRTTNPYRYNPLVADLPKLEVKINTNPIIGAIFTDTNGSSRDVSTTRANTQSTSTTVGFGTSVTVGVESTTSATVGGSLLDGPSAEVSESLSISASTTVSFDASMTSENQQTYEQMSAQGIEQSTTTNGGYVRVGVVVRNAGHIPFTLKHLSLASTRASDGVDPFIPLATLDYDGAQAFQPTSLAANQATGNLTFENATLDVGTVRTMLTAARSVQIEPAIYELTDVNDQPFAFQEAEVASRTAKVLIDYGPYAPSELYQVSTNAVPNSPGRSLETLLTDYLSIAFTESGGGLQTVRSISGGSGRWVVTSKRNTGTRFDVTIHDPLVQAYSVANIDVRAGDEVLLVYLEDADNDGLGYREELLHGTSPTSSDTDSDGLDDYTEVRDSWTVTTINAASPNRYPAKVSSSPVSADYDKDGLNDAQEKARGLDPYNPDTDGDGTPDNSDTNNGSENLVSQLVLTLGDRPSVVGDGALGVELKGTLSARAPRVVATATIDWESDGGADKTYNTAPGGNPTVNIAPQLKSYGAAGTYTIKVDAVDDGTPTPAELHQTAQVVLTEATRPITGDFGWTQGWRNGLYVRQVADLNQDGYDDIVMLGNGNTRAALGSPTGFGPVTDWGANGNWGRPVYQGVTSDPRFFVDLDNDGDLDIVGVEAATRIVRYGLNDGTTFAAPVVWMTLDSWDALHDEVRIVDVDNNGYPDLIHARNVGHNVRVYLTDGASLSVTALAPQGYDGVADPTRFPGWINYPLYAQDLDNDDCADLLLFAYDGTYARRSLCTGQFAAQWIKIIGAYGYNAGSWRTELHKRWLDDVNNDGLPDIVGLGNTTGTVMLNVSTPGNIAFGTGSAWTTDFITDDGWVDTRRGGSRDLFNIHPRYLADVNNDGYKDLVGYAAAGAAIGINMLGIDGTAAFSEVSVVAPAFSIAGAEWYEDFNNSAGYGCPNTGGCREYFPRLIGDVDGDGRVDLIGFDQSNVVLQFMPYVTQPQ
jgi:hypothetical protein